MNVTFRPAVRVNTPLIIGIAGPTKSGKTYSALRVANGLANGKPVAMVNAEGARGHQYADKFKYVAADITSPYRPDLYIESLHAALSTNPGCIIIDSVSHMHDGPGGMLEWHEELVTQMAGNDYAKRDRCNFTAWIKPKQAENKFIYELLSMPCPVILCMRAKEKLKIQPGKPPVDLGWQPIVGERVAFETIFTLMLTPGCKGVPSAQLSDMRDPFDKLVPFDKPISEDLGKSLRDWSKGNEKPEVQGAGDAEMPASHMRNAGSDYPQKASDTAPPAQSEGDDLFERAVNDYCAQFRTAVTALQCNELYKNAPANMKQAIYETYSKTLKELNKKR